MHVEKLVEIYYGIDAFLKEFMPYVEKHLLTSYRSKPTRKCSLNLSAIMTIVLHFHVVVWTPFLEPSRYVQFK